MCLNVILLESGSEEGKMLKLLVEVDLNKPLLRGKKLRLEDESLWVDFNYEMLPTFCFYCGLIGHFERVCAGKMTDSREGKVCEGQFGEWLRASEPRGVRMGDALGSKMRKNGDPRLELDSQIRNREDREQGSVYTILAQQNRPEIQGMEGEGGRGNTTDGEAQLQQGIKDKGESMDDESDQGRREEIVISGIVREKGMNIQEERINLRKEVVPMELVPDGQLSSYPGGGLREPLPELNQTKLQEEQNKEGSGRLSGGKKWKRLARQIRGRIDLTIKALR